MIVNYNNYNERGDRFAVFGEEQYDKTLRITEIQCSKKDQFCKSYAKLQFQIYYEGDHKLLEIHPKVYIIPIEKGDSAKYTLIKYCKKNYLKMNIVEKVIPTGKIISLKGETWMGTTIIQAKTLVKLPYE